MRIISFSSAATASFWALPVHALAPWMNRIRHSLGQVAPAARGDVDAPGQALSRLAVAASNDAVFAPGTPVRPVNTAFRGAPLKVIRESDSALGAECAGRMVISGRMADVCAELERMALRAAATQQPAITPTNPSELA